MYATEADLEVPTLVRDVYLSAAQQLNHANAINKRLSAIEAALGIAGDAGDDETPKPDGEEAVEEEGSEDEDDAGLSTVSSRTDPEEYSEESGEDATSDNEEQRDGEEEEDGMRRVAQGGRSEKMMGRRWYE